MKVTRFLRSVVVVSALARALLAFDRAQAQDDASDAIGFAPAPTTALPDAPVQHGASDDDAVGFAPPSLDQPAEDAPVEAPLAASNVSLRGFQRTELGLWTQQLENPFAKLRASIDGRFEHKGRVHQLVVSAHLEYDAAYLYERDSYDRATRDAYELVLIGGETFLGLHKGPFDFAVGRQVVAFGEGEVLSVLDVVNPRDMREPGLSELDDMRLAVLATRVGVSSERQRFELIAVHEAFFGLRPPPRAPLSPLRKALADDPMTAAVLGDRAIFYTDEPERFASPVPQLYARYGFRGHAFDFGLYAASTYLREGVLKTPPPEAFQATDLELVLEHPRYHLAGASAAFVFGPMVLKAELAYQHERPFNVGSLQSFPPVFEVRRDSAVEGLVGLSYQGPSQLVVALEAQKLTVLGGPRADELRYLYPVDALWVALRVGASFLRERLFLDAVGVTIGNPRHTGYLARAELSLKVRDALRVGVGYMAYGGGDEFGPLYGLGKRDRVFVRVRKDFALP